jgi:hypothetical protein
VQEIMQSTKINGMSQRGRRECREEKNASRRAEESKLKGAADGESSGGKKV